MSDTVILLNDSASESSAHDAPWHRIADDVVVTRDKAGLPKSYFRDDAWNIEAYGRNVANRNIHFRGLTPKNAGIELAWTTKRQCKQVVYFLMHKASDDVPAPSTLKGNMTTLRDFCSFAGTRHHTLYEALEAPDVVRGYIELDGKEIKSQRLHAILVHLHRLGFDETGLRVPLRQLHAPMLERFADRNDSAQHAVIPTRIYQHFLAACERELEMAESVAEELCNQILRANQGIRLEDAPGMQRLAEYFGCRLDVPGLSATVAEICAICQILILAYTGMRATEAQNLPYACLTVTRLDGVEHFSLEGITTKLSGGRIKRACWVTGHVAARAVRLAQRISKIAHEAHGSQGYAASTDGSHLLFCRMGILGQYDATRGPTGVDAYVDNLRNRSFPEIISTDVAELKLIDPHRAWEAEPEFGVGARWPFTRHQLRRTLALYAHRSGLVTLPSLKRQLHHITMEMSMYYARGSAFAKGFLDGDETHFARDWADAQGTSEYLAYAAQVLFSDERLFGGHAAWTQSKAVRESPVSVFSREQTLTMFKKGELAYRETVVGGCTSVEPCKSTPLNWLPVECLENNCKSLVVSPAKLQRVIKTQERQVQKLQALAIDSVEYRMEKQTLDSLLTAQQKLTSREAQ